MLIARIESLILNKGIDDAISRAEAYINAGADGIMIHSRKKDLMRFLNLLIFIINSTQESSCCSSFKL